MTKTIMNSILSLIASIDTDEANEVREALNAELSKGAERKAKTAELYDSFKSIVFDALAQATAPVTLSELYGAISGMLPEGVTQSKVQYAVTRLWADEIVKTEGKVNSYSLKA